MDNFRHFIRQLKVQEEGCKGDFPCKQKMVSHYSQPAARRAWSNGPAVAGLVAKGESHKAAAESGVPGFSFMRLRDEVTLSYPAYPVNPC